jgi:hypothetical protein
MHDSRILETMCRWKHGLILAYESRGATLQVTLDGIITEGTLRGSEWSLPLQVREGKVLNHQA